MSVYLDRILKRADIYLISTNMKKNPKNANYSFKDKEPSKRMGQGEYANMPDKPIQMKFSDKCDMRDGIRNSFVCSVEEISGIEENHR